MWIWGGYGDSGSLDDLHVLDLQSMAWQNPITSGTKPTPRRGHKAILIENDLMIFGGCNPKSNNCHQTTHYLNVDNLWWSSLDEEKYIVDAYSNM